MSFEDDEDELQAILDKAPEIDDIRFQSCVFCGDPATSWVSQDELVVSIEEWGEKLAPVCEECRDDLREDYEDCLACSLGFFCIEHDPLDWIKEVLDDELDDEER